MITFFKLLAAIVLLFALCFVLLVFILVFFRKHNAHTDQLIERTEDNKCTAMPGIEPPAKLM